MIAKQVIKSQGAEAELKSAHTVLRRRGHQCVAAVYQCTKPIFTHLWIFITLQQLEVWILLSLTHANAQHHKHANSGPAGLRSLSPEVQNSEEQRVLSHYDQLIGCLNTHTQCHMQTHALQELREYRECHVAMVTGSDVTALN